MRDRRFVLGALAASAFATPTLGQARYPDRPIRLIVPFGPGGLADVTARIVGERAGQILGQQIVIVNQPGAGGVQAARAALGAAADGYSLILFTNGTAISVPLVKARSTSGPSTSAPRRTSRRSFSRRWPASTWRSCRSAPRRMR